MNTVPHNYDLEFNALIHDIENEFTIPEKAETISNKYQVNNIIIKQ